VGNAPGMGDELENPEVVRARGRYAELRKREMGGGGTRIRVSQQSQDVACDEGKAKLKGSDCCRLGFW
jgi:hypothetical protein